MPELLGKVHVRAGTCSQSESPACWKAHVGSAWLASALPSLHTPPQALGSRSLSQVTEVPPGTLLIPEQRRQLTYDTHLQGRGSSRERASGEVLSNPGSTFKGLALWELKKSLPAAMPPCLLGGSTGTETAGVQAVPGGPGVLGLGGDIQMAPRPSHGDRCL